MPVRVPERADLEPAIFRIGNEIFSSLADQRPHIYQTDWWQGQALEWAMRDEDFKVRLFRFVDVFPTLKDANDIGSHIEEYFDGNGTGDLPAPLRWGLKASHPGHLSTKLVAKAVDYNIHGMAERFIAGRDALDAVDVLEKLRREGMTFTLDVLGEASLSEEEAREYQRRYLDLLHVLPMRAEAWEPHPVLDSSLWGELPRVNVSLKITSLYSQIDPADFEGSKEAVLEALRPIFRAGKKNGVFLNLDLEQFRYRDLTYAAFKDLLMEEEFRDYAHAGVVVQGYLRDSERDLRGLIEFVEQRGTPITVRLVKGAYWDYETVIARQEHWPVPVFTKKADTDANYEALTRLLVANCELVHPALGTHNIRSMAHALAVAEAAGLPQDVVEMQMLHGMAEPVKRVMVQRGLRLREYTPVGQVVPGMAYLVRRLLENTANESFLRMTFVEGADREAMLRPPLASPELGLGAPARPAVHATDPHKPGPFVNEPHADFSREVNRADMEAALAEVRSEFGRHYPLLIAGKEVDTRRRIESVNPAHPSQVLGTVGSAGEAEAARAVEAAVKAFPRWRDTPASGRAQILFRAADLMRREHFRLSALEVYEAGKPWREADGDVTEAIDFLEYYGREMLELGRPRRLDDIPGEIDLLAYEPRGVGVVIAPWNFPLAILTGMTSAALVTGNTVIMKPANPTPLIAFELYRILREAGLPEGVLAFLPGPGGEVGSFLVRHPQVDLVAFTGSKEVGLFILAEAARVRAGQRSLKRVIAEMGGKNAVIVDADADLDQAVEGTIVSSFHYTGQKCSACSRTIVLDGIYDAFVARLIEAARSLRVDDPVHPATRVGPVINEEAFTRIKSYIDKGRAEAELALAAPAPDDGYFIGPHIFLEVPPQGIIAQEEIFGPVLSVFRAANFDHALAMALDSQYALTGGLYSRSPLSIDRAYREFRVGNLYINRGITGAMVGRQPFGGFRMSGIGSKAGGPDYLRQFVEPRVVTENTLRRGFAPTEDGLTGI